MQEIEEKPLEIIEHLSGDLPRSHLRGSQTPTAPP